MLVFGVTADHKVIEKQRTALRNSSSRELPGGNVFIHSVGTKKDNAPSELAGFTGQVLGF